MADGEGYGPYMDGESWYPGKKLAESADGIWNAAIGAAAQHLAEIGKGYADEYAEFILNDLVPRIREMKKEVGGE